MYLILGYVTIKITLFTEQDDCFSNAKCVKNMFLSRKIGKRIRKE